MRSSFRYRAMDPSGKVLQGEVEASSEEALISDLRARQLTILDVQVQTKPVARPVPAASTATSKKTVGEISYKGGVSRKALALFTRQLATTLSAGLPLMRILSLLHKKTKNKGLHRVLEQMGQELQQGSSFSSALARHPRVFDSMYINMVKVGEAGGSLAETIARLALMLEKETALQRKVRGALFYPAFVLVFTVLIGYAMLAFMMPMFTPMFENSGMDIKGQYPLTWFLINASFYASDAQRMSVVVVIAVILGFLVRYFLNTNVGRFCRDYVLYYTPGFSLMIQQSSAARFSRAFSTLLNSGVPLLQALQLVSDSSGNAVISRCISRVARDIQSGDRISETLESVGVFPDLLVQMAAIGEEAGSLPEMLGRVADYYDDDLDATINAMTALIEPLMMLIVGGIVAIFVMGILLPILGISTAYQNQMSH